MMNVSNVVRKRDSLADILREMWDSRELIEQFVRRDLTVKYTQAVMGVAWALLMPVLIVLSGLLFRVAVGLMSGNPPASTDIVFLAVKALPWAFFAGSLTAATQSVLAHSYLIGKMYFPRETLPVASVLAQALDSLIAVAALAILLPILGASLGIASAWGILICVSLFAFTTGCALLLSCANLFFRDVKYIVQVLLNFGMFATPILVEPQMLGERGARVLLSLPLSPFIQGLGLSVAQNHNLATPLSVPGPNGLMIEVWSPWLLVYATTMGVVALLAGLHVFRRFSSRFAESV